ncbi:GIY-YIG nuclease family protein [Flagellimonas alvinocaridis]|uniref:GIY-YIG nuclease family protein n=1 Tax=Flagellimonas alvinocaridis TaxID=2530200 RepID=A0A4V4HXK4_9FLAO|nr:GIY-YIG nuclease family protein [Allomuricauda alvinocaridis]THV61376.1 GIY-YIG nuclease family protein [Allomuricauda alvinocaridis]
MEYFVYIIYSESVDRYYIGHCQDLEDRISRHNGGRSKYTKIALDWEVKYTESFSTRGDAMIREREIKKKKSRKYIEFLISEREG